MTNKTPHYAFVQPDFDSNPWHGSLNNTIALIDAAIFAATQLAGFTGEWTNSISVVNGERYVDVDTSVVYTCLVDHTTASTGSFADERAAHTAYWVAATLALTPRGAWAQSTNYAYYDLVYDQSEGVVGLCSTPHTSTDSGTIRDDSTNWVFIVDLSISGSSAATISFDSTHTSLGASQVQEAIDDLFDVVQAALATKAALVGPSFTGTPTAPTAAPGTNTAQLATTAFVAAAVTAILGGVDAAYDTLSEIAAALTAKANLASPTFTGVPAGPTAAGGTNSTQLATTAFVAAGFQPLKAILTALGALANSAGVLKNDGAGALSWVTALAAAVQADQETSTSNIVAVTPAVQQYHPSAAKFWAYVSVSAGTPTLQTSFNVTSITDSGVGDLTVTIDVDFSSANWALFALTTSDTTSAQSKAAGTCEVIAGHVGSTPITAQDPSWWSVMGFGDQ